MGNSQPLIDLSASNCRIVVLGPKAGEDCLSELSHLPSDAKILATGVDLAELQKDGGLFKEANVLLNVSGTAAVLGAIINEMPLLTWIHSITAGVDHILCPEITENQDIVLTNAKGIYSSSLGEYAIGACLYFAKDFNRLDRQKAEKSWEKYVVSELKGKVMGIVGYGDIGRACATLAKPFGMEVIALRKRPELSAGDEYVDEVLDMTHLVNVMQKSDYLVVALALTPATRGIINAAVLEQSKKGQVIINIARGAVFDENDLIAALQGDKLRGAALDVFIQEPLPQSSPLWELPNVLLSPHNGDMTADFRHKSVKFFTDNCRRFLNGEELESVVDKKHGY